MKYVCILVSIFVHSALGDFDSKVLKTFESVIDNLTVSAACNRSLTLYIENVISGDTDDWGLRMLDATSKVPVGMLYSYNFGELGDFDECLETESADGLIKPKYCLGSISIEIVIGNSVGALSAFQKQMSLRRTVGRIANLYLRDEVEDTGASIASISWAICLPSDCTDEDATEILSTLIGSNSPVCQTKDDLTPPLTKKAIAAIVILAIFVFILVASTAYDLYCIFYGQVASSALYVAFSVYSNGKKLFKVNKNSTELSCLNGIRVFSMMWVVIGHVFTAMSEASPILNFKAILDYLDVLRSMTIISGTLAVDSFFVIGGALVVYVYVKARHNGVKFNIFQYYLHRYLRLTPPLAAAVLVSATLLEYMGTGPRWMYVKTALEEPCQKHWWSTLLYIQNYVNPDEPCVGQSWYLDIDMQLFIVSPLLLLPLMKWPKAGISLVAACIVAFIISPFYVAYDKELAGIVTNLHPKSGPNDYSDYYYLKTHTRAAPWFMGLLLGYALATVKFKRNINDRPIRINKVLVLIVWAICLAVMLSCVYAGHSTLRKPEFYRVANAFYIALVRPAWSLCLTWVIFACVVGYGGPINWILTFPIYQVLNRFTYCLYLLHLTILDMIVLASKRGTYFSEFNMAYTFWGIYMFSYGISLLWVLAFESPVIVIEKYVFKGTSRLASMTGRLFQRNTRDSLVE